ncbi:DEAD/DEAH box helicase [Gephyromycinifex aptenodytis]|uniref:DEAD/DEAH box helicase n=1 Tax=Gephyromycinifex aptenodytis TaxID=2716227 RepID=UPI0014455F7B|nr:DEAD/DEAH box helicase [Gephyromycinifex aptenodytis]
MTQLLPSLQAERVRRSLVDYLSTTFALADAEPRRALAEFLEHPNDGIFKGPYVRLRLPFKPAEGSWREHLNWKPPFAPYRHQAEAYARLTSKNLGPDKPRPLPTVVTTGTGSGKTEAFLHPIVDHCLRARNRGERGIKALILYPMNALADDQARRLTSLLTGDPALAGITAGLYTGDAREGQSGQGRTKVSADGLITNRAVLRDDPPDILLTNYKMLDQLLLRPADQPLWEKSWQSLTYLVLDEFHTYDGAQGTDVAILLRRLGLALRSHVPADHPDRALYHGRPLGKVTPVATSATLGDAGDPSAMLAFATTVFGEQFTDDAAITEARVDIEDFTATARTASTGSAARELESLLAGDLADLAAVGRDHVGDPQRLLAETVAVLYRNDERHPLPDAPDEALLQAHPGVRSLIEAAEHATHIDDLTARLFASSAAADTAAARGALATILAGLSVIRAQTRDAVSVDVTLWLRELTRIDRVVSSEPGFRWSDDGATIDPDGQGDALPAIYCRGCGRSGWGVTLARTGRDLGDRDEKIRLDHMTNEGRFRALLHAPGEAAAVATAASAGAANPEEVAPNLRWLHMPQRTILTRPGDQDPDLLEGRVLPVVMLDGDSQDLEKRSRKDECPSCGRDDQIRFLGSAVATLLSVSLSTLFGDPDLDAGEKRSLVFTDSVQDAAHRAGFVDHRSHAMSLRTALRRPLTGWKSLPDWVDAAMRAAENDPFARYRLVPASLLTQAQFEPYWKLPVYTRVPATSRKAVRRRLLFDAALEVGLQTGYGRTLEATGSIGVYVSPGRSAELAAYGRAALGDVQQQTLDAEAVDAALTTWVRGVLERMRRDGAIDHEWLKKYVKDDGNRHWIWGGRRRDQGAPAFPRGRSAPAFPVVGGRIDTSKSALVPAASNRSWYARWAAKCLGVNTNHGASLATQLLAGLAEAGILSATPTDTGGTAYGIPAERIMVTPLDDVQLREDTTLLVCDTCRSPMPVAPNVSAQLANGPCHNLQCRGRLKEAPREAESFYRALFTDSDMRRVDAREHTSLLDAEERRKIEAGFKRPKQEPGDPNVLVATPTLEMGIDIGDLTTVMLASMPDAVAKYQQRVGRAGRFTGSSLALAYVPGRRENLPLLGDPTSMISGAVRPPATYLDAEEILQRQFLASVIDRMVRDGYSPMPRTAGEVLSSSEPGTLLGDLITRLHHEGPQFLADFIAGFDDPSAPGLGVLQTWVTATTQNSGGTRDTAEAAIHHAVGEHTREIEDLRRRQAEIEASIPELTERAASPAATDDDKRAVKSAKSEAKLLRTQISDRTTQPWIAGLELRGLLPNYSLMDDSVKLDAQVSWRDPETGDYGYEPLLVDRGSARALTELAPGAYFYAHRLEMRVDGVDLGQDNAEVVTHAACDQCGFVAQLSSPDEPSPRACPRCGSRGISETGQRFAAARLRRVFADVNRDDAAIGDDADDRRRTPFEIIPAVDFDPARLTEHWSVEAAGLGVAHYRRITVRWFNTGRLVASPQTMQIAGREAIAQLFRLCEACGKLDRGSGINVAREHRAWCRHRHSTDEHTLSLALARELVTQGVAIALPASVVGDMFSVPSLSAAVLLGLREHLGGAPNHLRVEVVPHPVRSDAGEVRQALFLHDTVPGGTGYLTELAKPDRLWAILVSAGKVVESCPCADEGRASCHRCLAPFGRDVYRVDALRALKALLGVDGDRALADLDPLVCEWQVTAEAMPVSGEDSPLEHELRALLRTRLGTFATVKETPTSRGKRLTITGAGNRVWFVDPQVDLDGVRPDFMVWTSGLPKIAVFADGRRYHASAVHNRLADDAVKRQRLRDTGTHVIAVTFDDLRSPTAPAWLNKQVVKLLMGQPAGAPGSGISMAVADEQEGGPLALIEGIIKDPESVPRRRLGDAVPLLVGILPGAVPQGVIGVGDDLVAVACDRLQERPVPISGEQTLLLYARDHLVFATRLKGDAALEVTLVLDDRPEALAQPNHVDAWRDWLRLSNALAFSDLPYRITTLTAQTSPTSPRIDLIESRNEVVVDTAVVADGLPGGWAGVDLDPDFTSPVIVELARLLAEAGAPPAEGGIELDSGSIADLVWSKAHVAVVDDTMPSDEIETLRRAGWTIHQADDNAADLSQLAESVAREFHSRDERLGD